MDSFHSPTNTYRPTVTSPTTLPKHNQDSMEPPSPVRRESSPSSSLLPFPPSRPASLTQWTWVWARSGRLKDREAWCAAVQGLKRVRHDWANEQQMGEQANIHVTGIPEKEWERAEDYLKIKWPRISQKSVKEQKPQIQGRKKNPKNIKLLRTKVSKEKSWR